MIGMAEKAVHSHEHIVPQLRSTAPAQCAQSPGRPRVFSATQPHSPIHASTISQLLQLGGACIPLS